LRKKRVLLPAKPTVAAGDLSNRAVVCGRSGAPEFRSPALRRFLIYRTVMAEAR